ncbi:unnamed protein product [Callosobruchus maculatus]|uniref:Uncharacterized protein n=1 Tax=Callosobruchus maculatus TaxID=64391 RepID=A0A653DIF7_CALMS|nr:unnamed protein product [Callosobruchus maculatus]
MHCLGQLQKTSTYCLLQHPNQQVGHNIPLCNMTLHHELQRLGRTKLQATGWTTRMFAPDGSIPGLYPR